jgi:hypothetical protein
MFVITHGLVPVAAAAAINVATLSKRAGTRVFSRLHLVLIGFAGVSPDLFSPHWRLSARLQSPTHTLWYLLASYLGCIFLAWWLGGNRKVVVAHAMWLAVFLHLACDALAGGIAWLYPLRTDVIGGPFIPFPVWWILSDILFVCSVVVLQYRAGYLEDMAGAAAERDRLQRAMLTSSSSSRSS